MNKIINSLLGFWLPIAIFLSNGITMYGRIKTNTISWIDISWSVVITLLVAMWLYEYKRDNDKAKTADLTPLLPLVSDSKDNGDLAAGVQQRTIDFKEDVDRELAGGVTLLVNTCYAASYDAGWHTARHTGGLLDRNRAEMLCLIHSEISEAMEGERKGLMDDHLPNRPMPEVELADAVIRIADYCGRWKYDLGGAIVEKLAYNAQRADHKPENREKEGGKKF